MLIVDDHPMFLDGLAFMLNEYDSLIVIGTKTSAKEAIQFIQNNDVDVVIMDVRMPELDGVAATEVILKMRPNIKVIGLTASEKENPAAKMFNVGAKGYLCKSGKIENVVEAINVVMQDKIFYQNKLYNSVDEICWCEDEFSCLSEREKEIIHYLASGLNSIDIGNELCISPLTVKTHRSNIMKKLKISTTADLIRLSIERNI